VLVRSILDCPEFLAGDSTRLRELLHPDKAPLALRYSLAHATLRPGETSLRHRLTVSEVYYIIEGEGDMHIEEETRRVRPGDAVYIPPHALQCITAIGPGELRFICIVDPAWRPELEAVLPEPS
jgi:mannose-6-phosphate isomerase-like protein (cupin superfamily)